MSTPIDFSWSERDISFPELSVKSFLSQSGFNSLIVRHLEAVLLFFGIIWDLVLDTGSSIVTKPLLIGRVAESLALSLSKWYFFSLRAGLKSPELFDREILELFLSSFFKTLLRLFLRKFLLDLPSESSSWLSWSVLGC